MIPALLVGLGMLVVSVLSYGITLDLIIHMVVRLIRNGYAGRNYWKNIALMTIVSLITAISHLLQIALWAFAILMCGATPTFETAFYGSAQNYTALGYGDLIFSGQWRLLGPLEAINGLLLFGLSTAVMFAIMSRLIAIRLHLHPSDAAVELERQ
jgi:hypothetical protein